MPFHANISNTLSGFFGSNYIAIGGTIIGVIVIIILFWYLMRLRSGRPGEEWALWKETRRLRKDERRGKADQKDERTQIKTIRTAVYEIFIMLPHGMEGIFDIHHSQQQIGLMLNRLEGEMESVQVALETFKILHQSINEFLSYLPKDNPKINRLVGIIQKHKEEYYADLIDELRMDEDEKKQLRAMWYNVVTEETGRGSLKAA